MGTMETLPLAANLLGNSKPGLFGFFNLKNVNYTKDLSSQGFFFEGDKLLCYMTYYNTLATKYVVFNTDIEADIVWSPQKNKQLQ